MDCGLVSSPSIPSNVVIIPTDAGCGTHLTALLILTMKTAPFWILTSAAALTVDPTKLSGIGDGNHTCHLPRFNAKDLLERSRNGRVVFAGDSIGRNQWESLLCMLASGVSSVSTIYEVKGLANGIKEDIVTMKQNQIRTRQVLKQNHIIA